MTAQIHEGLIIEGELTSMAFCPPLPDIHPKIKQLKHEDVRAKIEEEKVSLWVFSTACWRNYIGTWELKDAKLYLKDVRGIYYYDGDELIFADWLSCVLRVPDGELLQYVHMGFHSVYEFENYITIENGIVIQEKRIDNRDKDGNS